METERPFSCRRPSPSRFETKLSTRTDGRGARFYPRMIIVEDIVVVVVVVAHHGRVLSCSVGFGAFGK